MDREEGQDTRVQGCKCGPGEIFDSPDVAQNCSGFTIQVFVH